MRRNTVCLIFWIVLAVVSSSLLVVVGVWVGGWPGGGGGDGGDGPLSVNPTPISKPATPKFKVTVYADNGDVVRTFYTFGFEWTSNNNDVIKFKHPIRNDNRFHTIIFSGGRVIAVRLTEQERREWSLSSDQTD